MRDFLMREIETCCGSKPVKAPCRGAFEAKT